MAEAGKINPGELSSAAARMARRTRIMRAVYGGTETMRDAGEEFLPRYEKETQTRYEARRLSTFALNKTREAVEAASAKPFSTLVKVTNGDPDLEEMIKNIDLRGNHLHLFMHRFFNDALTVGQSHILVDHPDTVDMPSLAVQRESGARPYFKHIKDEQLVAAYTEVNGGTTRVVHARIRGQRIERTPEYKELVFNQIWVIEIEPGTESGVVQLWEQEAKSGGGGDWVLMGEKPLTMAEVPLITLHAGEQEDDFVTKPLFLDLAYKQIEHWISSSDQRSILAAGRFPMLACSGVTLDENDDQGFEIGPYKVLYSPEAQGRWYYVEPEGRAIESGFKDLAMLELHMDMMALNPVMATHRQYVPQNERDIQETRVHSVIHDLALSCKNAGEKAIRMMGIWNGKDYADVTLGLNLDFASTKAKIQQIGLLIKAWEKRGISREVFLKEAKALDFLGDEFDIKAELALMAHLDEIEAQEAKAKSTGDESGGDKRAENVDFPEGRERPDKQI